jgi:hypothetical protein
MRSILAATFFCLISLSAKAQKFSSSVSDSYDNKRLRNGVNIGDKSLNLIEDWNLRQTNVELTVRETDYEGKNVFKESSAKMKIKNPVGLRLQKIAGKAYIIYQEIHGNSVSNVMAAEIDTISLSVKEPRTITNIETVNYTAKLSPENTDGYDFYFKVSNDENNVMIVLSNSKTESQLFVAMLDKDLNIVWQKLEQINADDDIVSIKDACIDNKGNVYVAYRLFEGDRNKLPPKNLNHILILNKGKKIKDQPIDLGEAYSKSINLLPSKTDGIIHFAGYYFVSDFQSLQGVYSGRLNINELKVQNLRKDAFPSSMISQLDKDGWASSKGAAPGLKFVLYARLLELENGNLDVISEFRTSNPGTNYVAIISGSIVNAYIDPLQTSFSWIPKYRASSTYLNGDSFSAFSLNDKILVFYNDNEDNLKKDITEPAGTSNVYKNVVMVGAVIQSNGIITRNIVIDQQKENYMAFTEYIEKIDDNLFWIPLYKVKSLGGFTDDFKLGKVRIQ